MATSVKMKTGNPDGSSNGKIGFSVTKNNKVGSSSTKPGVDTKQKSVQTVTKSEIKSKVTTMKTTTSRVKKVFSLAGQKYDPPEEREPLRMFYESLSKQIPSSEMAEFWMMEHGLLSPERSRKAFERKQRRQKQIRSGIPIKSPPVRSPPMKSPPLRSPLVKSPPLRFPPVKSSPLRSPPPKPVSRPPSKPESSQRPQQASKNGDIKAKKRVADESDNDDDFILSPKRKKG